MYRLFDFSLLRLFTFSLFFYAGILIRYVILFHRRYTDYRHRMAGYFSGDEWERLRWVRRSFCMAFLIGILALLYALHPSALTNVLITLVLATYYAVFCLRFVNYAFTFHQIEPALSFDGPGLDTGSCTEEDGIITPPIYRNIPIANMKHS